MSLAADPAFWPRQVVAFCLVVLAAGLLMIFADQPLALLFRDDAPAWIGDAFGAITELGNGNALQTPLAALTLVLALLAWSGAAGRRAAALQLALGRCGFALGCSLGSGLLVQLLKGVVGRARPRLLFNEGTIGFAPLRWQGSVDSFPSGHAQAVCCAAICAALFWPRWRLPLLAAAALVAFSRVATTVHFASDVLVGAYIGAAAPLIVLRCWPAWMRRLARPRAAGRPALQAA